MSFERPCPLCGSQAQYEPVGFPAPRRHYLCPSCGEFVIEEFGERVIAGYTPEFRAKLSREAKKTVGDYVYVISVGRREKETNVDADAVLRSKVLR